MDLLEHQAITDVIIMSVVLEEVKHRNQSIYQRLRSLCSSDTKRFFVFANENHRQANLLICGWATHQCCHPAKHTCCQWPDRMPGRLGMHSNRTLTCVCSHTMLDQFCNANFSAYLLKCAAGLCACDSACMHVLQGLSCLLPHKLASAIPNSVTSSSLCIDSSVSPNLACCSKFMPYLHLGPVKTVWSIWGTQQLHSTAMHSSPSAMLLTRQLFLH